MFHLPVVDVLQERPSAQNVSLKHTTASSN